uniref:Leucine-rich repeat protein 1-like n=1 Tax=Elaeis guineensis var. tenera TaxID=51953 RepID=A0A8N4ETX9_ELAGV|nr:leucine-rich repeat protein 1-like [Elaeis guineensis]
MGWRVVLVTMLEENSVVPKKPYFFPNWLEKELLMVIEMAPGQEEQGRRGKRMEVNTPSMIIVFVPLLLCVLVPEIFQPLTATAVSTQRGNNATHWYSLLAFRSLISDDPLSLTGGIPPSLGNLSFLDALALESNDLHGVIPPSLGNLSNLLDLAVYNNNLSGVIPPSLGSLALLNSLDLSFNSLTGGIPPSLGNLSFLDALALESNDLHGVIPPSLGNLSNLVHLALYNINLSGVIPPSFGRLSLLNTLDLSYNSLT